MADIIMPKMGDAMTEGKVVRWYKKAGDSVKTGEPVLEIETDKVNLDLEAEADGVIDDVRAEEGATVEVGGVLAVILVDGEAPAERKPAESKPAAEKPAEQKAEQKPAERPEEEKSSGEDGDAREVKPAAAKETRPKQQESAQVVPIQGQRSSGRQRSSPLARRMARDRGVDIASVAGSGPGGRIVAADIEKASASGATEATAQQLKPATTIEGKDIPLTAMRRTIAKRLAESIGPIPHFFLTIEADVTSLLSLRAQLNEIEGIKTSVNDFVVRASALTLLQHPNVNSSFGPEAIRQHGDVHVGIAVATPEGLITPVIRNADRKSVAEIAGEVKNLAEKARNRKLMPDEYQGATFTISNLGMFGIEEFTAIINPPNAAILAVGAAMAKPVVVERQVVVRDRMRLTMSCDHRVVDGAAGAEFLRTLQHYLEQPLRLLL
jgi:pyruvate dehydrogenase E2 component (dihydrolipoamide acetyltransferase)